MIDWNKRNGGFLDDFNVMNYQVNNLSQQIDKLKLELQRKDNIINNITKYVRTFKTDEITTRELCILNDILLITEEKENIVARLKEKSGK